MDLDSKTGWVNGLQWVKSPNFDDRPAGCRPEVIVVHAISLPPGEFGGPAIEQLFCNCLNPAAHPSFSEIHGLQVSSHFLIRRAGEMVQFVSVNHRAWHAGKSFVEGRERVNDFSIGVELEGCDDKPFEELQYQSLAALTRLLFQAFPDIQTNRIYGHSDIAPGRKTDPGPYFDWRRYREDLGTGSASGRGNKEG